MRFVLFVEGRTEKEAIAGFLKRWLDPRLGPQKPGIQIVQFRGWSSLAADLVKRAHAHLDGPRGDDIIAVVALLDLHGPGFYPNRLKSANERHDWAVAHFEKQVSQDRFRMFFAVHDVEAWILSQPDHLPQPVAKALPRKARKPESVNFDEPPSKLLARLYRDKTSRSYKKTTDSKVLLQRLDPEVAFKACPRLHAMLNAMLEMAKARGL